MIFCFFLTIGNVLILVLVRRTTASSDYTPTADEENQNKAINPTPSSTSTSSDFPSATADTASNGDNKYGTF
jgi:hypothetical protein